MELKRQKAKTYVAADKYVCTPEMLQKIDERHLEQILKVTISNSSTKELY